jgi:2,4-dienoyl-CoA reductase (NADPH2)
MARRGVKMINGVEYLKIDDAGLHILQGGQPELLEVDTIIVCAGQDPARDLFDELARIGMPAELIGGAYEAAELDAKAAIKQASYLAAAA